MLTKRAMEMLEQVGINNVEKRMKQYPHELIRWYATACYDRDGTDLSSETADR